MWNSLINVEYVVISVDFSILGYISVLSDLSEDGQIRYKCVQFNLRNQIQIIFCIC